MPFQPCRDIGPFLFLRDHTANTTCSLLTGHVRPPLIFEVLTSNSEITHILGLRFQFLKKFSKKINNFKVMKYPSLGTGSSHGPENRTSLRTGSSHGL